MKLKAELIEVSETVYHENGMIATPCYSNSIGKTILSKSPKHAWIKHPKLNPNFEGDDDKKFALGTVAHAALLQGLDICEPLDFADFRTNDAKAARDSAYLAGKIPMLATQFDEVQLMVAAGIKQLESCSDLGIKISDGKPEQTILLHSGETVIKMRLDWLANDSSLIIDYKTTDLQTPGQFMKNVVSNGYDMQAALYTDGVEYLTGIRPKFVFAVQETAAPFAMYFVGIDGQIMDFGQTRNNRAINIWENCIAQNRWPMYPPQIMWADLLPWQEGEFLEKEMMLGEVKRTDPVWKTFTREEFLFGKVK